MRLCCHDWYLPHQTFLRQSLQMFHRAASEHHEFLSWLRNCLRFCHIFETPFSIQPPYFLQIMPEVDKDF